MLVFPMASRNIALLVFSAATIAVAADAPDRQMHPWELEGPMVPAFEIRPITARPALLIDPADVADVRRRFEAAPGHPETTPKRMGSTLHALLYGDEESRRQATREFMNRVRQVFSKDGLHGFGMPNTLSQKRRTSELLYEYDIIASFGHLTAAEADEFKDDVVRAVDFFIGSDPARFPSKATPNANPEEYATGFAAGNRWTDAFLAAGLAGLTFPELPQSKAWVQYAVQQTLFQLEAGDMDGAWPEVPRYHHWTLLLLSGWLPALERRTGLALYDDPHLKALVDWPVRFSSPLVRFPQITARHPRGVPCNPAWGDSDYGNPFAVCALYGSAYARSDPEFSRRLMWMWRRAGSPWQGGWQFGLIFPMLVDPALPDAPQTLGSECCRELGYVALRSGFDTPHETWVTMRAGQAHNHKRFDLGSIDIFSHGIPLVCGAQSGPYREPEILWNRWVGANNAVAFMGQAETTGPKVSNPYVDVRGLQSVHSGTLKAFFTSPTVDYAAGDCSRSRARRVSEVDAFQWVRHLAFVKNPDYLLVWDQCDSVMSSRWFLHTTATEFEWKRGSITAKTAYGVDLDVHVLSPTDEQAPNEKQGPFGAWSYSDPKSDANEPYPFRMLKYFTLSATPKTDYVTVLQPRSQSDPSLAVSLVSLGKDRVVVRVACDGRTDELILTPHGGSYMRGDQPRVALPHAVEWPPASSSIPPTPTHP